MPYKDRFSPHVRRKHARSCYRSRDRQVAKLREVVNGLKVNNPCQDCGKYYPHWVMQFDHIEGHKKYLEVSCMVKWGYSLERVFAEIAKCELVCANCHANRTHVRKERAKKHDRDKSQKKTKKQSNKTHRGAPR